MNCPRCKSGLVVVEYSDVELDWCPECGGLWFDSGEMELLARKTTDNPGEGGLCPSEPAITREDRLKCPLCRRKMDKRLLGHPNPVIADVCPHCDGLWLDQGELEQVLGRSTDIPSGGDASHTILIEHLRGTFGEGPRYHAETKPAAPGSEES